MREISSRYPIQQRYLPERSHIVFYYPLRSGKVIQFYLPFLENIDIDERQKSNLAEYDLIGRPGSMFSYLGSKSREFSIKFNITLDHITNYVTKEGLEERFQGSFLRYNLTKDQEIEKFIRTPDTDVPQATDLALGPSFDFFKIARDQFALLTQNTGQPSDNIFQETVNFITEDVISNNIERSSVGVQNFSSKTAVNLMALWVSVVRSSVVGNVSDPTLGPPILYLNHGILYKNVPCICTDIGIRIVPVGYSLLTMTPKQIEISMSLRESRTGDFGKFEPFNIINGDNITGWESVIEHGTMDPWNGTLDMAINFGSTTAPRREIN